MLGAVTPGVSYPGAISYSTSTAEPISDTLVSMSDALASRRIFQISDTLTASMWDTFFPIQTTADTLVTFSDALASHRIRPIVDTAVATNVVLRLSYYRTITDTLASIDDLLASNNMYARRIVLSGTSGSTLGSTRGATSEPGEWLWGTIAQTGFTVWYQWTAPTEGKYRFAVRPDLVNTPLADPWITVYPYDPGAVIPQQGFAYVFNDEATFTDASQENDAVVNLYALAGETFVIQVGAWRPGQSVFTLEWFEITAEPD